MIKLQKISDKRGFFTRSWDKKEFEKNGINPELVQCNISFNRKKGTLRGMHYQIDPHAEAKLVRCTKGSIFDVIIDLRPKSKTFLKWFGIKLTEKNYKMLYIPDGFAHGFQTLEDDTEVFYQMSQFYNPKYSAGIRWDDKAFGIKWPISSIIISKRDCTYPCFQEE